MQIRACSWREAMLEREPEGATSADCRKLVAGKKQCGKFSTAT
jgi:hypothetical protein